MPSKIKSVWEPFPEFILDIGKGWVSLMSGIIGVCLWALGALAEPVPVSLRWTFLVLAVPAIVLACYLGWLKKIPRLIARIEQTVVGQHGDRGVVTLTLTVLNTGEPSIAEFWTICAHLTDGRTVRGDHEFIDTRKLLSPGATTPTREIAEEDALYRKTMNAIPKGGMVRGYLIASFLGVSQSQLNQAGTKIVVEFSDVWGRQHSCSHVLGTGIPLAEAHDVPV